MDREENYCSSCDLPSNNGLWSQNLDNYCQCDINSTVDDIQLPMCGNCGAPIESTIPDDGWQQILKTNICACEKPSVVTDRLVNFLLQVKYSAYKNRTIGDEEKEPSDEFELDSDRYKILDEIGRGGAGKVYRCKDIRLRKKVAVKLLHKLTKEKLIAFQKEAQSTSTLNHKYIIEIFDFGVTNNGIPYMIMENIEGVSLSKAIRELGYLEPESALNIASMIAQSLVYSHSHGIYHRDLKPDNIILMLDDKLQPSIKLIDFGIAKVQSSTQEFKGKELQGTPAYMPPDYVLGKNYNESSEVYSLGCVLFEILTGHTPFQEISVLEILNAHAKITPPRLSEFAYTEFPDSLESFIEKCLKKDQKDRFQTMQECLHSLQEIELSIPQKLIRTQKIEKAQSPTIDTEPKTIADPTKATLVRNVGITIIIACLGTTIYWLSLNNSTKSEKSNEPITDTPRIKTSKKIHAIACTSKYCKIGNSYLKNRNFRDAIKMFRRGLSKNPKCANAYLGIGKAEFSMGHKQEALAALDRAIGLNPKLANSYLLRSRIYRKDDDVEKAMNDATTAIELNPNLAEAYIVRAKCTFFLTSFEPNSKVPHGLADINRAIEIEPENFDAYEAKGVYLASHKKIKEAIQCFSKAIELNPKEDDSYLNRSAAYSHLGEIENAIKDLDAVIKMKPKDSKPWKLKAGIYEQQKQYKKALDSLNKAIDLSNKAFDLYSVRAKIYEKQNNYDSAVKDYTKIISLNGIDDDAFKKRGDAYFKLGKYKKALADYNEAIDLYPKSSSHFRARSRVYEKLGKIEKSKQDFETAAKIDSAPAVKKI